MSESYEIVYPKNTQDIGIGLILKDKKKNQYKICEIRTNTSFTAERLTFIINNLKKYQETVKKKYTNAKSAFIFPGKLSPRYESFFKKNNIEVWDREYIISTFKNEIIKLDNPYFIGTGLFAIIIARKYNEKKIADLLSTIWQLENKMIVILDDKDIEQMLIEKMRYTI